MFFGSFPTLPVSVSVIVKSRTCQDETVCVVCCVFIVVGLNTLVILIHNAKVLFLLLLFVCLDVKSTSVFIGQKKLEVIREATRTATSPSALR